MKKHDEKTVKIKRFRYSLDWFMVDDVEVSIERGWSYELQFRLGCWYLCHRHYDKQQEKWVSRWEKDFRLDDPAEAVIKLGDRIRAFTRLHDENLADEVTRLMQIVAARRVAISETQEGK